MDRPVGDDVTNMADVDVISSRTLSLREREIKFMVENSVRLPPRAHNLTLKSAARADLLDSADQVPQVPSSYCIRALLYPCSRHNKSLSKVQQDV